LDEVSQQAIEENRHTERSRVPPDTVTANASGTDSPGRWRAVTGDIP
jgi:hypothetical protein